MKKYTVFLFFIACLLIPKISFAETLKDSIVSETTKYYKTISQDMYFEKNIETFEITEQEFNNSNDEGLTRNLDGYIETTYKKLTTTISKSDNYYQYKAVLDWKSIPNIKSYDIIGIGFYQSVKVTGSVNFSQNYCLTNGNCYTSRVYTPQTFSSGAGASFQLPNNGNLSSLKQTLNFLVTKNADATIISQIASGDYSHATSSVTAANAKKYTVNANGISLDSSIANSYDSISFARATWSGTW